MKITENTMKSWDGTELFYRSWLPKKKSKRAIILFHRGHEHSGRWQDVIEKLDLPDTNFFAWDARGHGRSPGERGYAENFGCLIKDVDAFVRYISEQYNIAYNDIIVMAHSVGSVLVSTWVHDYAPNIRALVLGSPALRVRLYIPFAISGLRLLQKVKGKAFISSYVKGKLLTHDKVKQKSYDEDSLITPNIAVNILLGLYDAGTRLIRDSGAINLPVLILSSGADFVVKQSAQRDYYDGLSHLRKEMQSFPGFLHDTFNEKDNYKPLNKARLFITEAFDRGYEEVDLLDADKRGYTKEEYDQLCVLPKLFSPKAIQFTITRIMMKTFGRMSEGIRTGWKYGFDSGSMLDYVYKNKAKGFSPIGTIMDRLYLDSAGWVGIRQRKINLEKLLNQCIEALHSDAKEIRITDVATGHGRYVLDAIKQHSDKSIIALLRDYSDRNVEAGRALADELGLENVSYAKGDAFSKKSLNEIKIKPNIGIVSGLFELFPDNKLIMTTLTSLASKIEVGGYLIYTNQPWHPQLEFIAHVLSNHKGADRWVMRRRTQQEMDQLVRSAGFEKITMEIDEHGIFSVSLARKV